uniref:Kinesin motor domain-containing protein n=1 Tax=Brugia timori TaxID=42155 RepID=A0A0R3QLU8_9BILA
LAMPYDRPDSLSVRLSSPNKLASLGRNHSERNQAEEIPLPPALHRFLVAPTTRSPSSPQLKTVLRLADEDLENVTVHGNSFVFRCNQSGISKSFSKYTFDQIFASDATIQQICSVCLPDLLQTCFSGSDACFIYFGAVSKVTSHDIVTIREDSVLGIKIENHSELRVDSVKQAMLMINDVIQARITGNSLKYLQFKYKKNTSQLIGGRSRLCLVDLGLGERTSKGDVQAMTMPVITNLLVALFQGQRYLPSRQSPLCMLLKESLGNAQVKASLLFASLSDRVSESENILQMMSKIQRAAKPRKTHRIGSDSSSSDSTRRRLATNSEGNSSSEQSCAETVIFLGPSVRIEPTAEQQQPKRRTNGNTIDSAKRKMILDWIKDTQESSYSQPAKISVCVQCNEDDIDMENLQQYGCRRQLDDILEDDEEASGCHSPRSLPTTEQFLESFQNIGTLQQPLSILSLDKISASTSGKSASENEVEDDDLERAMAASISSIRSHEILSRLNDDLSEIHSENISESDSSLSGFYRGIMKPEAYTEEKMLQFTETYEKKKKKKLVPLSCCRSSMLSSGSSGGYGQPNSFAILKTIEKQDTNENNQLKSGTFPPPLLDQSMVIMKNSNSIPMSSTTTVPRSSTHPLNNCLAKNNRSEALTKSKLPRRTAESKVSPEKQPMLLERTPLQYFTNKSSRRDSLDSKKEAKKGKRIIERRNSSDANQRTTTFVTDAKQDTGAYSSGHGSDENGSIYSRPLLTLLSPRSNRPRNRESFSASSGYESATGVDVVKNYGSLSKRRLFEVSRTYSSNKHSLLMDKRVNLIIRRQNHLRDDLREAKRLLGVADEHFLTASTSSLQGTTLLEALTQETRILEKRLIACRNHAMIVTCLLKLWIGTVNFEFFVKETVD